MILTICWQCFIVQWVTYGNADIAWLSNNVRTIQYMWTLQLPKLQSSISVTRDSDSDLFRWQSHRGGNMVRHAILVWCKIVPFQIAKMCTLLNCQLPNRHILDQMLSGVNLSQAVSKKIPSSSPEFLVQILDPMLRVSKLWQVWREASDMSRHQVHPVSNLIFQVFHFSISGFTHLALFSG